MDLRTLLSPLELWHGIGQDEVAAWTSVAGPRPSHCMGAHPPPSPEPSLETSARGSAEQ